jgi:predicted GNAT superfamily acetyltransferase
MPKARTQVELKMRSKATKNSQGKRLKEQTPWPLEAGQVELELKKFKAPTSSSKRSFYPERHRDLDMACTLANYKWLHKLYCPNCPLAPAL